MLPTLPRPRIWLTLALAAAVGGSLIAATGASASAGQDRGGFLRPGNLLVSGSVYENDPGLLTPGATVLPPGCTSGCVLPIYESDQAVRTQELIFTSENLRLILEEWQRIWFLDQPSHLSPYRTHGGII